MIKKLPLKLGLLFLFVFAFSASFTISGNAEGTTSSNPACCAAVYFADGSVSYVAASMATYIAEASKQECDISYGHWEMTTKGEVCSHLLQPSYPIAGWDCYHGCVY
jgi:hypothetical protein